MTTLNEILKNMPTPELSPDIHQQIMRQVWWLHFKTPLVAVGLLGLVNVLISGRYLWNKIFATDVFGLTTIVKNFDLNFSYLNFSLKQITASVPNSIIANFFLDLILLVLGVYLFLAFSKTAGHGNFDKPEKNK